MKLKLPQPGHYGNVEAEGTPEELAALLKALGTAPQAPILIPTMWTLDVCPQGGAHEYPEAWWSISPAPCKKCGQTMWQQPHFEVTWSDRADPNAPCHTTQTISLGDPLPSPQEPLGCTD